MVGHTSVLSETKTGEMALLRQDEGMEQWTAVDGSAQTLQRRNGSDAVLPGTPGQGNLNSPTYNLLDGLPTDPEALLKHISDDAEENHGAGSESTTGPHQRAFVTIGDLLRTGGTPPTPLLLSTVPLLSFPESTSSPTPWTQQFGTGSLWPGHTTANASSGSSTRAPSVFWTNARSSWKTTPGVRLHRCHLRCPHRLRNCRRGWADQLLRGQHWCRLGVATRKGDRCSALTSVRPA